MDQLIERFLKVRLEVKLAGLAGALLVMFGLVYFFWITDLEQSQQGQQQQIQKLEDDLIQKQAIANNLAGVSPTEGNPRAAPSGGAHRAP